MQLPVWIFKSGCTSYVASTHLYNWLKLSAPIIHLSSSVFFTILQYSPQFCLIILDAIGHSGSQEQYGMLNVRPYLFFEPIVILQLRNVGCLHISFLVLWNSHICSAYSSSLRMIHLCLDALLINNLIPQCNTSLIKIIFHLPRTLCLFPGTCVSYPLIL